MFGFLVHAGGWVLKQLGGTAHAQRTLSYAYCPLGSLSLFFIILQVVRYLISRSYSIHGWICTIIYTEGKMRLSIFSGHPNIASTGWYCLECGWHLSSFGQITLLWTNIQYQNLQNFNYWPLCHHFAIFIMVGVRIPNWKIVSLTNYL